MIPFAVAAIQLEISNKHSNIDIMEEKLNKLMLIYPWVQMVVFSELAPFGAWIDNASAFGSNIDKLFMEWAKKHNIWLIPGSRFVLEDSKTFNLAMVINPEGEIVGTYKKMFPFRPYEKGVSEGSEFLVFDVPDVGKFGVSICYDIWFPETSRTLAALGVEVLIHPSMTGTLDRSVEMTIVRATAVQNQFYVIDVNGVGDGGVGQSMFVSPNGDIIHQSGVVEEFIPIELDLRLVRRVREFGVLGLGQPLKSFRDSKVNFDVYSSNSDKYAYLDTLGSLEKPNQNCKKGLQSSHNLP